jgi:hypothetical protein
MLYDSTRTAELSSPSMRALLKDERRSESRVLKAVDKRETTVQTLMIVGVP